MPFGRNIEPSRLISAGFDLLRLLPRLVIVKRPLTFLWHYLRQTSPEYVDLRSGHRFYFSSHPHDLVSFCLVFMKREYGTVYEGDVVFDIGANIGSFAIYAALSGANKVYSFEPSLEAFRVLTKNIQANQLESVIIPFNKAVTERSGEAVRFPSSSSPFNSLAITAVPGSKMHVDRFSGDLHNNALAMAARSDIDYVDIPTISLQDVLVEYNVFFVNFMKMDCEGAEFSIVPSWTEEMFKRIGRIRMECHGDSAELVNLFRNNGFLIELLKGEDIWLVNRQLSYTGRTG